ncbi:MAG: hypothetical protein MUE30_05195 [Spirosomaceae bacterium]|jgi:uracil-DNA glycosylase|nr:hypothetical protein [Spirosomataceae bacterium]
MSQYPNPGYDPAEIQLLRDECEEEGQNFVFCEDEEVDMNQSDELAHVQFVGKYKGQEVIYDAVISTLPLYHSSLVYEQALGQVTKLYPKYLPPEERGPSYKMNPKDEEEAEEMLLEIMDAIEEEEDIKVKEAIEIEPSFDYGVGVEVYLNVETITEEVIERFVKQFNDGTLKLDPTLYSFKSAEEE